MDKNMDLQKDKNISTIPYNPDLFHNDRDFYLAYRKIENIVAAIFLVTGLIEADILIKNTIREHSLECLNRIVRLIGKSGVSITDIQAVASFLLHLTSLLDIAFWSGQVSQMNLSMVQREIAGTYKTLNDLSVKYKNSFYIGSKFFKTEQDIFADVAMKEESNHQGHNKGQDKRQIIKDNKEGQETIQPSQSRGHRRESILNLLRQRSNLSVKDFIAVVPEYSEKTIQRELLSLVEEGVIRKEGERRWSTYSLAT